MIIKELTEEKFDEDLRAARGEIFDKYESPSGNHVLELSYSGEYPHGDSHHYCQIKSKKNNEVIWEYTKGDKIREVTEYPWSPDSKTVYFGLIENGNKIAKYDLNAERLKILYKSKQGEYRLNWINFVPQSFNGIVIKSNYQMDDEYIVFINETDELIHLKDIFNGRIFPCPSHIDNCIYVIGNESICLFNVKEKKIKKMEPYDLLKTGFFPKYTPRYLPNTGEAYVKLEYLEERRYISIK